jgi:teichuronic acid biosynthesis glycosyltransferase TuaH
MSFGDVIFVSLESWDEVWRRNQFLCSGLARRFPQTKILFVGPPRDVSNAVRRRDFCDLRGEVTWKVPGLENITVTRPLKLAPDTLDGGRRWNERMFRSHVARTAREVGLKRPLLWLNPHSAVHMTGRMGERGVVYDITDDWTLTSSPDWEKRLIAQQDRRLCQKADLVVVCSESLRETRQPWSKRLLLLPNGVDVEHYLAAPTPGADSSSAASTCGPVFGYTGTLHDDRVDCNLVLALARAFPQGRVRLVGPDFLSPASRALLVGQPNVELVGPVPYAEIVSAMRPFNVCIVPHHESAFTQSLNPIKLWEYLACGKPIVSTNVAGFRDYPHLVEVASQAPEFIEACRRALGEGQSRTAARREVAARNSWQARLDELLATLESLDLTPKNATQSATHNAPPSASA